MPSLSEMKAAGYTPKTKKSSTDQILGFINGLDEQAQKKQEEERKDLKDQVALYNNLREAGYSSEDAHARVTRSYRSTGFIEKMIGGGQDSAFQKPTEQDSAGMKRQESILDLQQKKANIGKTKADTRKSVAAARYSDRRGTGRATGDGYSISQKRGRMNDLMALDNPFGMYSDDSEAAAAAKQEISILNDEIATLSSKSPTEAGRSSVAQVGKIRVKRLVDGKTGTIEAKDFDPKKYAKV